MVSLSEEYAMSLSDHAANFPRVFQHLLRQKQLVDVTLVADGIFIDAHRLVLSAVSPYFRQMFTQMPENQRTFGKILVNIHCSYHLIRNNFFHFFPLLKCQ